MMSKVAEIFRPRRGLHVRRTTTIKVVLFSAVVALACAGVVSFYEFYRLIQVRQDAAVRAIQIEYSNRLPVVKLLADKNAGDLIAGDFEVKYLDEDLVPESIIDISTLEAGNYKARRDMSAKVILTYDDLIAEEEWIPDSMKIREYRDLIDVPEGAMAGDVVDVILARSSGEVYEEFIVLSSKKIEYLSGRTIHFAMEDDTERYLMGSALTEARYFEGVSLRLDHYPDPQIQEAAKVNYEPPFERQLIETDEMQNPVEVDTEVKGNDGDTVSSSEDGTGIDNDKRADDGSGTS